MPRISRIVVPNCPHHVIQRGNRKQTVFFSEEDRSLYLKLLDRQCRKWGISILAYCLMSNHVHLIAVPHSARSFARGFGEAHRQYTTIINIRQNWKGFLWQGRFISFPLEEKHAYAAVRYVERNPVRAGIVDSAEKFPWSSARAHVLDIRDPLLSENKKLLNIENWSRFLAIQDEESFMERIRNNEFTGRPLGSGEFVKKLEKLIHRKLQPSRGGRKKNLNLPIASGDRRNSETGIVSPNQEISPLK
jgi:putative transposase